MNSHIGENIKKLRIAKNMTQAELAERVGITNATISAYENTTRLPSYDVLIKLAHLFHVSTDNILGFSDKFVIDVSHLNNRQRNTVQEIIDLYKLKNKDLNNSMDSDSIERDLLSSFYVNEFDIGNYKENNK